MAVINPPGWLENAGLTHTAAQLRSYIGALIGGSATVSTDLKPRAGLHPTLGDQMQVNQTAVPSMAVDVLSGVAAIPGTQSATQGAYFVANDGTVTLTIATAHATLPRIDIVQVRVRDSFYSGASNDALIDVKTGTAASSPVAPVADANAIVLAEVLVGAGVTSITNSNITDKRTYYSGVGGVINVTLEASPPPTASIIEGQLWWSNNTDKLKIFDGATHQTLWDKNVQGAGIGSSVFVRKTSDESRANTTAVTADSQLTLALASNSTYIIDGLIIYNSTDLSADLHLNFSAPTSAQAFTGGAGPAPSATDTIGSGEFFADRNTTGPTSFVVGVGGNSSFDAGYTFKAMVVTAGSSGSFTLNWGPNASTATPLTVFAGSFMRAIKVA